MGKEKYLIEADTATGMTFREGIICLLLNMGFMGALGIALAISAVAEMLPWIILAAAVGGSVLTWTITRCILMLRSGQTEKTNTPEIVVISSKDQAWLEAYQPPLLPQPKKRGWLWKR